MRDAAAAAANGGYSHPSTDAAAIDADAAAVAAATAAIAAAAGADSDGDGSGSSSDGSAVAVPVRSVPVPIAALARQQQQQQQQRRRGSSGGCAAPVDAAEAAAVAKAQRDLLADAPHLTCAAATDRGTPKLGPQDFEILRVVGQGAFGKVCCTGGDVCVCVCVVVGWGGTIARQHTQQAAAPTRPRAAHDTPQVFQVRARATGKVYAMKVMRKERILQKV
jgi:hypothetical protein